jgi:sugar phosphate isomerase/epimerase
MLKYGIQLLFGKNYNKNYQEEVDYVKTLGFDFFQITFFEGIVRADALPEPKEQSLQNVTFPFILHVVFDLPDYEKYSKKLLNLINFFGHKEVIIHPIFEAEPITKNTILCFSKKIESIHNKLKQNNVKLFLENNGIAGSFFNDITELRTIFDKYPDIGLILDIAHANNYDHLKKIVDMRFPECLHIADRHFDVVHEHIPLGDGDLDFEMIFKEIIPNYNGKIILEAVGTKTCIEQSKKIMNKLF